jgi:hypothetical protein
VAALKSWKVIGDALTDVSDQHDLPEETRLLGIYRDAAGTYTEYAKLFLDQYWLGSVPEHLIGTKVTRDSNQRGDLMIRNVFDELLTDVGEPLERVLDRSGGKPLYDSQRAKQFGASLNKIKEGNQYDRIYRACRSALNNWRKLSTNVFEARRTLLSAQAAVFREDYTPFSYESPAQFVDMYWAELTLEALRKLADQVQSEGTRALDRLRSQYGSKFPLARDSGIYLTQEEFIDVRSLLNKVSPEKDWEKTTVGAGAATGLAGADSQLERLRSPAPPDKWVDTIYQLFQSLPKGGDPYYCRMTLLSEKQQRRLLPEGQELLLDYLTEFRLSQGTQSSARFNTRSRENLILDNVKYPGPPVRIDFYQYPSDPDGNPRTTLEFAQPWACLKIFCLHAEPDKGKGYVKLDVKEKEGLGGVLYLQLEFCRERDSKCDVSLPKLGEWPSLER